MYIQGGYYHLHPLTIYVILTLVKYHILKYLNILIPMTECPVVIQTYFFQNENNSFYILDY